MITLNDNKEKLQFFKKGIKQIQNKYLSPTPLQSLIKTLVNKRLIKNGVLKDANKKGKNHHRISAFLSLGPLSTQKLDLYL